MEKLYAFIVKYQDVISGFFSGMFLMISMNYFQIRDGWMGLTMLIVSIVNLIAVGQRIGGHGKRD